MYGALLADDSAKAKDLLVLVKEVYRYCRE
jgi:hypothetical protein